MVLKLEDYRTSALHLEEAKLSNYHHNLNMALTVGASLNISTLTAAQKYASSECAGDSRRSIP